MSWLIYYLLHQYNEKVIIQINVVWTSNEFSERHVDNFVNEKQKQKKEFNWCINVVKYDKGLFYE